MDLNADEPRQSVDIGKDSETKSLIPQEATQESSFTPYGSFPKIQKTIRSAFP